MVRPLLLLEQTAMDVAERKLPARAPAGDGPEPVHGAAPTHDRRSPQ
ncbi:MAG TPA: hypothetical protein VE776_04415 [Actinomycetota bacterium]|jgi:hypothetical protein|nr:hypothetical protein [Actinomycetota bacterium]